MRFARFAWAQLWISLWAAVVPTAAVFADSCGPVPMTPMTPVDCQRLSPPHCVCDQAGNCHWQFDCIPYGGSERDSGQHNPGGGDHDDRDSRHRR